MNPCFMNNRNLTYGGQYKYKSLYLVQILKIKMFKDYVINAIKS
jgi:hypothetical protein